MSGTRIEGYRRRLQAASEQLRAIPPEPGGDLSAPDPETGERWDRLNVLGHTAEMLPFWVEQIRGLRAGATTIGRTEEQYLGRRQAIDGAAAVGEDNLRARIEDGIAQLLALLDEVRDDDLDRRVTYHHPVRGDREVAVEYALEELLVGHLEAHIRQLAELTTSRR
jgi:DinB superfamily